MPESNIDIIIKTKRTGDAPQETIKELDTMKTGLSDLEKAMAGTRTTIGGLDRDLGGTSGSMGSMADAMSGLGLALPITPMALFGEAIQAGGQFAKDSIAEYSAYVDQISKMAAYTSTSTEEMSKLYQITDDLRIPVGDLEMALKTMTHKGTAPSIAGIQELSEKYLAIQDPLARAQFLTENFGRAGQEMGRLMEMGALGIDSAADSIANWMIVTGKSEQQIKDYLATQDRWGEALDEVKYQFAMGVTPTVTKFMDALLDTNDTVNDAGDIWWKWVPIVRVLITEFDIFKNLLESFADIKIPEINLPSANPFKYMQDLSDLLKTGGGRAEGGSIFPGSIYKVGEREVEYISTGIPAMVTPASAGNSGVGTLVFNYQPMVSLADQAETQRILIPAIRAALRNI